MEPEDSFPHSQEPATCPNHKPAPLKIPDEQSPQETTCYA
jgi:hypothetical protein